MLRPAGGKGEGACSDLHGSWGVARLCTRRRRQGGAGTTAAQDPKHLRLFTASCSFAWRTARVGRQHAPLGSSPGLPVTRGRREACKGDSSYPVAELSSYLVAELWWTAKTEQQKSPKFFMRVMCGVVKVRQVAKHKAMAACDRRALKHERPSHRRAEAVIFFDANPHLCASLSWPLSSCAYAEAGAPSSHTNDVRSAHCPIATCQYCNTAVIYVAVIPTVSGWTSAQRSYTELMLLGAPDC